MVSFSFVSHHHQSCFWGPRVGEAKPSGVSCDRLINLENENLQINLLQKIYSQKRGVMDGVLRGPVSLTQPHDRDLCYVVLLVVGKEAPGLEHDMAKATERRSGGLLHILKNGANETNLGQQNVFTMGILKN